MLYATPNLDDADRLVLDEIQQMRTELRHTVRPSSVGAAVEAGAYAMGTAHFPDARTCCLKPGGPRSKGD